VRDLRLAQRGADAVEQLRLLLYGVEVREMYAEVQRSCGRKGDAAVRRYLRQCVAQGTRPSPLRTIELYINETTQVGRRLPQEEHHRRLPYYRELVKVLWEVLINTPYGRENLPNLKPKRVILALLLKMQQAGEVLSMSQEMQRVKGGVSEELFDALCHTTVELVPADAHLQEWLPRVPDLHRLCQRLKKQPDKRAFNALSRGKVKEGTEQLRRCYQSVLDRIFYTNMPPAAALKYLQAQQPSTYMTLWREPGWDGRL